MSYIPPEYGRYNPGPVFRGDGTHRAFRIYDGSYLPPEPVYDWRRGHTKRLWEGQEKEAVEICRMLNENREMLGKPVQSEMTRTSKTQKIMRMNAARQRKQRESGLIRGSDGSSSKVITSLFVRCDVCGSMNSGGEHTCLT